MPLHKVEDLFTGLPNMLVMLTEALLKKKRFHEAKGVWLRHKLNQHAPHLKKSLEFEYLAKFD
jgi:hypothetical protein